MKKNLYHFSNFGFSTILLSFVMICVVTFSALSLVTANSDHKLSQKVADRTTVYYKATELAYEHLAEIENILHNCYLSTENKADYYKLAESLLSKPDDNGTIMGFWTMKNGQYTLNYLENISDGCTLNITLLIHHPSDTHKTFFEIQNWSCVYEQKLPKDDYLDVMQ